MVTAIANAMNSLESSGQHLPRHKVSQATCACPFGQWCVFASKQHKARHHGAIDCESTPSNAVKQPQQCDQIVEAIDGEPEASYGGDQ